MNETETTKPKDPSDDDLNGINQGDASIPDAAYAEAKTQNELLDDRLGMAKAARFTADTTLRRNLSYIFSAIIALWLASVICLLFLVKLEENVFIILLTTSTINVIGMMHIILKNLFPNSENKPS